MVKGFESPVILRMIAELKVRELIMMERHLFVYQPEHEISALIVAEDGS